MQILKKPRSLYDFRFLLSPVFITLVLLEMYRRFPGVEVHTFSELFSIIVGILMFVIAWNTRSFSKNDFLTYLGIGYFWIALLDLFHTFTFVGIPFFNIEGPEVMVHFWIYARILEALILLTAPVFLTRRLNSTLVFMGFSIIAILAGWASFMEIAPTMISSGSPTSFKKGLEYAIMIMISAAVLLYVKERRIIPPKVLFYSIAAMLFTVSAELFLTLYMQISDIIGAIGHILKVISFWCIYRAIVITTLKEPFTVLTKAYNSYDAIPHPAVVVDNNATILQLNRAAAELAGKPPAELTYKPVHGIFHPQNTPEESCPLCSAIKEGHAIRGELIQFPEKDRWGIISLAPVDAGIFSSEMVQTFHDITERIQAENDKAELEYQLLQAQKMDAVGRLAGGVAHDFNNILGGIMNSASLLKRRQNSLDEKSLKYLGWIMEASERAGDLVSKLLTISRKEESEIRILNLPDLIQDIIQILNRTITKEIEISVSGELENPFVSGSQSALHSAFLNLAINSVHAIERKGKIEIIYSSVTLNEDEYMNSLFQVSSGPYSCIEVRDSGSGIPEMSLDKIFDPFFTTKEQGKGTGLGLATTLGTIQSHKGVIEVTSELGRGTSVKIYLPCSHTIQPSDNMDFLEKGISRNILLVDDDELNRITGRDLIESIGHKVYLAENWKEAIESYNTHKIDIVILDLIMPGKSGYDLFHELIKIDGKCKIIISSGYPTSTQIEEMRRVGLAGVICKPYKIEELQKIISKI